MPISIISNPIDNHIENNNNNKESVFAMIKEKYYKLQKIPMTIKTRFKSASKQSNINNNNYLIKKSNVLDLTLI